MTRAPVHEFEARAGWPIAASADKFCVHCWREVVLRDSCNVHGGYVGTLTLEFKRRKSVAGGNIKRSLGDQ